MKWPTAILLTAAAVCVGCQREQPAQGRYRMLKAEPTSVWVLDTLTGTVCVEVFMGSESSDGKGPLVAWCKPWPGGDAEADKAERAAYLANEAARKTGIIDDLGLGAPDPGRMR